ncbi:uncharacterized protein LOC143051546 [Mytilus galloprovincialis]|uniref:uncharacterized protein LOC143051546 n=1 Tax=Mytilus galloprovincialis TaxID=29158 RepID=UPI003F7BF4B8
MINVLQLSQGISQLFINQYAIVIIIVSNEDITATEKIANVWRNFAFKGIQHVIITNLSQNSTSDVIQQTVQTFEVLDESLNTSKQSQPQVIRIPRTYHKLHTAGEKGFLTILITLLREEKDKVITGMDNLKKLKNTILKQRKDVVFCSTLDYNKIVTLADNENLLNRLTAQGLILKHGCYHNEGDFICVNPQLFLKLVYAIHIDSCNKTFHIAPNRFWHQDRPDRESLVKVLEDIPINGLLRQCLLPLLWQDLLSNKDQILLVSTEMERFGLLMPYKKMSMFSDVISLKDYPQLSSVDQLSLLMMGKMNDLKPSLNWYDDLQTSDIQLKLKVLFPQGVPPGCLERYIGAVYFVYKYVNNYYYGWKSGILLRIKDVYIYITTQNESLEYFVRTDIDLYSSFEEACKTLWMTVGLALDCFLNHVSIWQELNYQVYLSADGEQFRSCNIIGASSLTALLTNRYKKKDDIEEELETRVKILFPFQDFEVTDEKDVIQQWTHYLKSKTGRSLEIDRKETQPALELEMIKPKTTVKKNKRKDITWNVKTTDKPTSSSTESIHTQPNIKTVKCSANDAKLQLRIDKPVIKQKMTKTEDLAYTSNGPKCDNNIERCKADVEMDIQKAVGSFVATILASAVAAYIGEESGRRGKWTTYQASVASEMAEAIMFVNSNDVMAAANTIINTVEKAEKPDSSNTRQCCLDGSLCYCGHTKDQREQRSKLSSICTLL